MKSILLFCIYVLLLYSIGFGTTHYVSTTGNDGNVGDGPGDGDAFATLKKGLDTAATGDTVEMVAGTYTEALTLGVDAGEDIGDEALLIQPYNSGSVTINTGAVAFLIKISNDDYGAGDEDTTTLVFKDIIFDGVNTTFYLIWADGTKKLLFDNCTFTCGAGTNGAIWGEDTPADIYNRKITLENCTLTGTAGTQSLVYEEEGSIYLNNCTVDGTLNALNTTAHTIWFKPSAAASFEIRNSTILSNISGAADSPPYISAVIIAPTVQTTTNIFTGNTINALEYGISYNQYCDYAEITNNIVDSVGTSLLITSAVGPMVKGNEITGATCIGLDGVTDSYIHNNYCNSDSALAGNTIRIGNTGLDCVRPNIKYNIFTNTAATRAVKFWTENKHYDTSIDYNLYWTDGGDLYFIDNTSSINTLAGIQAVWETGKDSNKVFQTGDFDSIPNIDITLNEVNSKIQNPGVKKTIVLRDTNNNNFVVGLDNTNTNIGISGATFKDTLY